MTNKSVIHNAYRLSILVRLDGFSFYTQDYYSNAILETGQIHFSKPISPLTIDQELIAFIKKNNIVVEDCKKLNLVYANNLFVVVPQSLFDDTKLEDYLKFNTKVLPNDFIAYDQIAHHDIVNVYIPFANVNNYFFDIIGSFEYQHSLSVLIEYALKKSERSTTAAVQVYPTSFDIVIVNNKKVALANTFKYNTKEDFIYYLLFTFEQLNIDNELVELVFNGDITSNDENFNMAYTYVKNVSIENENHANLLTQT